MLMMASNDESISDWIRAMVFSCASWARLSLFSTCLRWLISFIRCRVLATWLLYVESIISINTRVVPRICLSACFLAFAGGIPACMASTIIAICLSVSRICEASQRARKYSTSSIISSTGLLFFSSFSLLTVSTKLLWIWLCWISRSSLGKCACQMASSVWKW